MRTRDLLSGRRSATALYHLSNYNEMDRQWRSCDAIDNRWARAFTPQLGAFLFSLFYISLFFISISSC